MSDLRRIIRNMRKRAEKDERAEEIERAARNLLDNADGHYMNAEDMYALQTALGYFDENRGR